MANNAHGFHFRESISFPEILCMFLDDATVQREIAGWITCGSVYRLRRDCQPCQSDIIQSRN